MPLESQWLEKWHCNSCHENFFTPMEGDNVWNCPYCGAESVYCVGGSWIANKKSLGYSYEEEVVLIA